MFDTKLRRQSIARDDLFHGHIGGMDTMARALLAAASIVEEGELDRRRDARYVAWEGRRDILDGKVSLQELHDEQLTGDEPVAVSGRQELLESLVARHIERAR
jgi:xylose isomerase